MFKKIKNVFLFIIKLSLVVVVIVSIIIMTKSIENSDSDYQKLLLSIEKGTDFILLNNKIDKLIKEKEEQNDKINLLINYYDLMRVLNEVNPNEYDRETNNCYNKH